MQQVEGDAGDGEELPGVGGREADVGEGETGKVGGAVGEEFGGPDTEDDAGVPRGVRVGWSGGDCGGDEAHDCFGVVVELGGGEKGKCQHFLVEKGEWEEEMAGERGAV